MYGKFFIVLTVNGPSLLLGDTKPHAPLGPLCLDPGLYTLSGMLVRGGQTNYILGDLYFIQLLQLPLFSAQLKLSTTWSKGREAISSSNTAGRTHRPKHCNRWRAG